MEWLIQVLFFQGLTSTLLLSCLLSMNISVLDSTVFQNFKFGILPPQAKKEETDKEENSLVITFSKGSFPSRPCFLGSFLCLSSEECVECVHSLLLRSLLGRHLRSDAPTSYSRIVLASTQPPYSLTALSFYQLPSDHSQNVSSLREGTTKINKDRSGLI